MDCSIYYWRSCLIWFDQIYTQSCRIWSSLKHFLKIRFSILIHESFILGGERNPVIVTEEAEVAAWEDGYQSHRVMQPCIFKNFIHWEKKSTVPKGGQGGTEIWEIWPAACTHRFIVKRKRVLWSPPYTDFYSVACRRTEYKTLQKTLKMDPWN